MRGFKPPETFAVFETVSRVFSHMRHLRIVVKFCELDIIRCLEISMLSLE